MIGDNIDVLELNRRMLEVSDVSSEEVIRWAKHIGYDYDVKHNLFRMVKPANIPNDYLLDRITQYICTASSAIVNMEDMIITYLRQMNFVYVAWAHGLGTAVIGARLPKKSQYKAQIIWDKYNPMGCRIGEEDEKLLIRLMGAANKEDDSHDKFGRHTFVSMFIRGSRSFWQQMSTYSVGVSSPQSESTMHTMMSRDASPWDISSASPNYTFGMLDNLNENIQNGDFLKAVMGKPEGWLQTRHITFTYTTLARIYNQRKHHKHLEWRLFLTQCEIAVPYWDLLIKTKGY